MNKEESIASATCKFNDDKHLFERFLNGVVDFFKLEPSLNQYGTPVIHTIKSRLKNESHLKDKLERKWDDANPISAANIYEKITDLAGVRVLHLYQDQFPNIHKHIMNQITNREWFLHEEPKVYSWDPEAIEFFKKLGLATEIKASYYTSIHYVVKPKADSNICCEIQVRTLFEEIWGEIDHSMNYPHAIENQACKEQLRVLSKLVSTGTRLADSIFRTKELTVQN
ncbi:RelA/SpoT domain-containing protein [Janthinobacterium sp. 17J80-10]|uniref:RelA/SpoT domain-containing protein n=1 Tax=Janthinobacterium sp. 17J80-10 TaxID=2497863 RepID=UPI0010054D77|nr:RelA/SpoT domain-containing protein [Janthinobacterium sp. 17J80-10]QAU34907.1 (p)ppGpp synthetase [Janthinobacterium sp. 17J80-10]